MGGSGPNNYSSIQEGINAAQPRDIVFVYQNTYHEHVPLNKSISLIGESRSSTTITGDGAGSVVTITASNSTIQSFSIIQGGVYGIVAQSLWNVQIRDCDVAYHTLFGIYLAQSTNCRIIDTISHHNDRYGIYCVPCTGCEIQSCTVHDNEDIHYYQHSIVVNGCTDTLINNCLVYNGYYGILVSYSPKTIVTNCVSYENAGYGVQIFHSDYCTVTQTHTYDNIGFAIFVEGSSSCLVQDCICHDSMCEVFLFSSANSNTVLHCTAYNTSWEGIYVRSNCHYNIITECLVYHNHEGICVFWDSSDNLLYHNTVFNNDNNAYDDGVNQWDNGYPSGGNYWDDYHGVDTNGDGIGDTPYNITGAYSQDRYPLMRPWGETISYTVIDLGVLPETEASIAYSLNEAGSVVGSSGELYGLQEAFQWARGTLRGLGMFPGDLWSEACGINNLGTIVGSSHARACLWENEHIVDLGSLGNGNCVSYGYDINNQGQAVGTSYIEEHQWQPPHAFLWTETKGMSDLGLFPSYTGSVARACNNNGLVVGTCSYTDDAGTHEQGFLWTPLDGMIPVATGFEHSDLCDINDQGDIIGTASTVSGSCAFVWHNQDIIELGSLGGSKTNAYGMNNTCAIVGASCLAGNEVMHAFLWDAGVLYDLNDLIPHSSGWVLLAAHAINDQGCVVGTGINPDGETHAFLLQPLLSS